MFAPPPAASDNQTIPDCRWLFAAWDPDGRSLARERTRRRQSHSAAPPSLPSRPRGESFHLFQRELQIVRLIARHRDRIDAGVARRAVRPLPRPDGREHALETEI